MILSFFIADECVKHETENTPIKFLRRLLFPLTFGGTVEPSTRCIKLYIFLKGFPISHLIPIHNTYDLK